MAHKTQEISQIIVALETQHITCCIVGTAALIHYGAQRVLHDWELCVPSSLYHQAVEYLSSEDESSTPIHACRPSRPQPSSTNHLHARFLCPSDRSIFVVLPDEEVHLDLSRTERVYDANNIPYPALRDLAQSLLDTSNEVGLCDLVDGADIDIEWGVTNLDLSGTKDVDWAVQMNSRIKRLCEHPSDRVAIFPTCSRPRREFWSHIANASSKKGRLGCQKSPSCFDTRFRLAARPANVASLTSAHGAG
ncbi:hypothetical protein EJ05DRAFT_496965 [Pseudovirgaria hyperparasitica]|uniref:Uncharacterized protein n=1 Tax=Pseudovirgaria hyperparasitica TaxID=470096 RepID=A0A6A6WH13_9PEZI|nr:uncharacterized protein EJ05DRAFT_496965 [Pseudovirgaria hyperparasitica]KAF2762093.1 hypothetical protein EJ05DRAFT_496965 [Pseudovirgaria hyperparasitica]